jgi:hypothetical protein
LLEVGYTRIVSFKLWYYYTYLVIGLSLLGIGSGGVLVAVCKPMRRWATDRIIGICSLISAVTIAAGYYVIARTGINTIAIWDYGSRASFRNLAVLGFICFTLFAAFISLGVIISVLLGRASERVGRLYFADLVGAGLGCLLAIPLIVRLGPPRVVALSALTFAVVGLWSLPWRSAGFAFGSVVAAFLAVAVVSTSFLPDVRVRSTLRARSTPTGARCSASTWSSSPRTCPTVCSCTTARTGRGSGRSTATRARRRGSRRIPARSRSRSSARRPSAS